VRIAKNDLQLKVFIRREVQSLTVADTLKRLNARERLSKISCTWFSDENIFTMEMPSNRQSDPVYANVKAKCVTKSTALFSNSLLAS